MAAFEVEDYGPLIVVTFLRVTTEAECVAALEQMASAYQRAPRVAFVIDPSPAPNLPASQRSLIGRWLSAHDEMVRRQCVGLSFVFTSAVSRFVLSSIFLLWPPSCPYAVCSSRAEALQRTDPWLRRVGINPAPLLSRATESAERRRTSA
ncbi:MAG TPA: hypothetical protein VFS00_11770 [Polyangiaceae bacterium]|nr:hypothetical protein [Polyangiaceae bacterium]